MLAMERCLMSKQKRTFCPEFKQQAACLVLDQGYSHTEASRSVGIGESVLCRCLCAHREPLPDAPV